MDIPESNIQYNEIQLKPKPKRPKVNSIGAGNKEFVGRLQKANTLDIFDDYFTTKNLINGCSSTPDNDLIKKINLYQVFKHQCCQNNIEISEFTLI